jgi:hypothetical protein
MQTVDEFASTLLEEAKRFLEIAKETQGEMAEAPTLHAALLLSLCSLEAYVNAAADAFSARSDLSVHERGVLLERDVQLLDGTFQNTNKLRMSRLEDRIELLHQKFSMIGGLDTSAVWRSELAGAIDLRNKLTHPKAIPLITVGAVEKSIDAVIKTVNALYLALYDRELPSLGLGLSSKLPFGDINAR